MSLSESLSNTDNQAELPPVVFLAVAAIEDDDVYEDDDEEVDAPPLEVVEESTPPPTGIPHDAIYPEGLPGVDTVFVFPNNVQRREFQGGCSVLLLIGLLSNASPMPERSALAGIILLLRRCQPLL
jgi:hypothetical protein